MNRNTNVDAMNRKWTRRRFVGRVAGVAMAAWGVPRVVGAAGPSRPGASDEWGDLVGRFLYDGAPPPRKKLKVDKDIDCCGRFDIRDESLMVGPDGGLAGVYVYARDRRIRVCPELAASIEKEVLLDNRDCIFKPHCLAIWCERQTLKIVNSDPVAQNVAFSPLGDAPANIILPPPPNRAATATWTFRRPQRKPAPIACNYHPWESAFILPLAHPYCTVSRADGTFRIARLPIGPIEFQLWHERVGYLDAPRFARGRITATIAPGENDLGTFHLAPALFAQES